MHNANVLSPVATAPSNFLCSVTWASAELPKPPVPRPCAPRDRPTAGYRGQCSGSEWRISARSADIGAGSGAPSLHPPDPAFTATHGAAVMTRAAANTWTLWLLRKAVWILASDCGAHPASSTNQEPTWGNWQTDGPLAQTAFLAPWTRHAAANARKKPVQTR